MSRRLRVVLILALLCLPGTIAFLTDAYFGFPVQSALFTDAIGSVEKYVMQPVFGRP